MDIVKLTLIFTAIPVIYYVSLKMQNITFDILKDKTEISYYKQQDFQSVLRLVGFVLYPTPISMVIGILCYLFKVNEIILSSIEAISYISIYIYMVILIKTSDVKGNLSNKGGLYWKLNNNNKDNYNYMKLIPLLIIITFCFISISYDLFKYIFIHDNDTLFSLSLSVAYLLYFINIIWGFISIEVGLYNSKTVRIYLNKNSYVEGKILSMENGLILFLPLYCIKPFYFNQNLVKSIEIISVNNTNNKTFFNKVFNVFD